MWPTSWVHRDEYHLEKYLRDAKITQLWLGGQQVSRYRVARGYYDYVVE